MLSDTQTHTLDNVVEAIDQKIDKRLDAFEISQKKEGFQIKSNYNFTDKVCKGLVKNKDQREFELKANELFVSEVNSGTYVPAMYEAGIKSEPFQNDLRAFFPQGSTNSDTVTVNRGVYATNAAAITTEATQYPESTNTLDAVSFSVDKIAHRFDLSEEFLGDVAGASQFITSQIQGGLIEQINANIITDVKANDTDFAAGNFALSVESANEFDVLSVALNQLRLNSYNPDVILVNPDDFVKMVLLKDTTNTYLRGTLGTSLQENIQGVNIVQSAAVTSGTYHVMDSARYGRYYNRESLTVKVGYDGNDFSSGTRTAIAVHRGTLAVFDIKALVTGTFSNNKTALETA